MKRAEFYVEFTHVPGTRAGILVGARNFAGAEMAFRRQARKMRFLACTILAITRSLPDEQKYGHE